MHQGRAGGVALWPLAGVHQVEGAALRSGPVVAVGVLEAPVPALQGPRQGGAFYLKIHPVARRKVAKLEREKRNKWKERTSRIQSGNKMGVIC